MRIRKALAKALGQLKPNAPPSADPWPVPSSSSQNSDDGLSDISCPLNQSPWDVYPNHRFVRSSFKCGLEYVQSLLNPMEEHEDISAEIPESDEDVMGKKPTMETIEEQSHLRKRVTARSKSKRKEDTVEIENNKIMMCKKTDGKNWFCKQPAKLPHNFCEHHLRLSRSYKDPSGSGVGGTAKIQKETKTFNSDYYYYGTVAPFGGKRRGGRNAADDSSNNVAHVEEVKMDIIDVTDENEDEVLDEDDIINMPDEHIDEDDIINVPDEDEDDIINVPDEDEDDEDEVKVLDDNAKSNSNNEESLKISEKKERKLVKYRSLDSFSATEAETESSAASDSD